MKYHKIKDFKKKYSADELWEKYDKERTIENRNILIEHYLYLLYKPVKSIYPICRSSNEMQDIFQSAVIGLIEAVETYSKEKNASFKTFSRWRIHGSIIDYLRKTGLMSLPYKTRKKINAELERDYDFENPYHIASLEAIAESSESGSFISNLRTDVDELTENVVEEKIMLENIYRILEKLPFDEYTTVIHYYLYGRTLDDIAKKLKMTRSGVWQLKNRAIKNINAML